MCGHPNVPTVRVVPHVDAGRGVRVDAGRYSLCPGRPRVVHRVAGRRGTGRDGRARRESKSPENRGRRDSAASRFIEILPLMLVSPKTFWTARQPRTHRRPGLSSVGSHGGVIVRATRKETLRVIAGPLSREPGASVRSPHGRAAFLAHRGSAPSRRAVPRARAGRVGLPPGIGAAEPEDLLGDVFVAVIRGLPTWDGDRAAMPRWVFTVAHHRLIDARRKATRRGYSVELDTAHEPWTNNTYDEVLGRVSASPAIAALAALTPDQRDVVLLRECAGTSRSPIPHMCSERSPARSRRHTGAHWLHSRVGSKGKAVRSASVVETSRRVAAAPLLADLREELLVAAGRGWNLPAPTSRRWASSDTLSRAGGHEPSDDARPAERRAR